MVSNTNNIDQKLLDWLKYPNTEIHFALYYDQNGEYKFNGIGKVGENNDVVSNQLRSHRYQRFRRYCNSFI